jgi:hypothetical protein
MELTSNVSQILKFDKKETPHLREVNITFYNGNLNSFLFGVVDGGFYEIRGNIYDALKEVHFVLGKIIELEEGNKAEIEKIINKGRTRLIRLSEIKEKDGTK